MPVDPGTHRVRWTQEAFVRLIDNEILDGESYELLEGDILKKVKNPPHILAFVLSIGALSQVFGPMYCQPEGPVEISTEEGTTSLPEPDIAVLNRPLSETRPRMNEVSLLVEISDATLARDLDQKARLYARAGAVEYWVLDVEGRRLHVHRGPQENGQWSEVAVLDEAQSVAPLAAPDRSVAVRDLLPKLS